MIGNHGRRWLAVALLAHGAGCIGLAAEEAPEPEPEPEPVVPDEPEHRCPREGTPDEPPPGCDAGEVCAPGARVVTSPGGGREVERVCVEPGGRAAAALTPCAGCAEGLCRDDGCRSGVCRDGLCAGVCGDDGACPFATACEDVDAAALGIDGATLSICAGGRLCGDPGGACPAGEVCRMRIDDTRGLEAEHRAATGLCGLPLEGATPWLGRCVLPDRLDHEACTGGHCAVFCGFSTDPRPLCAPSWCTGPCGSDAECPFPMGCHAMNDDEYDRIDPPLMGRCELTYVCADDRDCGTDGTSTCGLLASEGTLVTECRATVGGGARGAPCQDGAACVSGLCAPLPGGGVCTTPCIAEQAHTPCEELVPGTTCKPVEATFGGVGRVVTACMP